MGKKNKIKSFLKKKLKIKKFFLHKSVFKGFIRTMVFILNMMIINKLGEVTITETQLEGMSTQLEGMSLEVIPSIEQNGPAMAGPAEGKITNFFGAGRGCNWFIMCLISYMGLLIRKLMMNKENNIYFFSKINIAPKYLILF